MSGRLWLIAGVFPLAILGQKIDIQYDHDVNFSQYRTFAIREGNIHTANPALNSELVRRNIEDSIRKHLTSRGLTESAEKPDLNVRFSLGAAPRRDVEVFPPGWRWGPRRQTVAHYTEGTLVVDLRDPQKRQLVWRGIAVADKKNAAQIEHHLDEMIRKTIEKYPPKRR